MPGVKKLTMEQDGNEVPVVWPDTFEVQQTTGPARLVIGARTPVALLREVLPMFGSEYFLLYVLAIPRGEGEPGRYESTAVDPAFVDDFLARFERLLEDDARHQFWIGSTGGPGLLVFERHGLIYAYGPVEELQAKLQEDGFQEGPLRFPVPHMHHYRAEHDADSAALLDALPWHRTELREGDDD